MFCCKSARTPRSSLLIVALLAALIPRSGSAADPSRSVYLIGNSLTWDTVPSRLDGDVQWHVDCGKSLPYIFAHPEAPCVKSSTLWPQALKAKQYDFVTFQTHYGSTLDEDAKVIGEWVSLQPKAVFIIHTGWAHHEKREVEYSSDDVSGKMQHSPAYMAALLSRLRERFPNREFRQTHAIDLLAKVAADITESKAPLKAVADLHRDAIHVRVDSGRYLMHNAMRQALGQPRSNAGFETIDPTLKTYLDSVLDSLPEQQPAQPD